MSKQYFKKGLPQLRFLEFKDGSEWNQKKLSDPKVATFVKEKGKVSSLTLDTYISTENILPDYQGVITASKLPPSGSFTLYKNNDVLISNIRPYLKKVWHADKAGAASNDILVIRAGSDVNSLYLLYLLKNDNFIDYMMSSAKGVKMPRGDIESIRNYPVFVPEREEQTKIAECLSSLDDVITTNTKKLDSLKLHKKGLMQKLFPTEGRDVPELRLIGFDKSWETKKFSTYIKLFRGSSPRPISEYITKSNCGVNWIKIGDTSQISDFIIRSVSQRITPDGASKSRYVKKGELILANSMSYGSTYQLDIDGYIYDGWFVLREYEDFFDKQYLLQVLNSNYIQDQYKKLAAGGIVQNISSDIVNSVVVPKPTIEEQKKIADVLNSIDDLIKFESVKIETLKNYKLGLMQRLFPSFKELAI
ncbi:type I restriction enzyme S subunit [Vibrio sp. ES.051]|uniref:restriction endonuclease subunit S n=1 Tax=Vibrio sp. ES.051 TaxID=1761909 RepID=UPI000BF326A6|nr:restriction endonuclease subunit S [Vibrio sp. ES.051]PFG46181.1 type I restriction enzyme S subunit [Vibrio sp. ES.051]